MKNATRSVSALCNRARDLCAAIEIGDTSGIARLKTVIDELRAAHPREMTIRSRRDYSIKRGQSVIADYELRMNTAATTTATQTDWGSLPELEQNDWGSLPSESAGEQ